MSAMRMRNKRRSSVINQLFIPAIKFIDAFALFGSTMAVPEMQITLPNVSSGLELGYRVLGLVQLRPSSQSVYK
jgi:hypothetical protein